MTIPELVYRGRQEAAKRLDQLRAGQDARRSPHAVLRELSLEPSLKIPLSRMRDAGVGELARRLLDDFRETGPSRFFAGSMCEQALRRVAAETPGVRERAIAAAEAVLLKRFDLLGYRALSFGDPIDWHLDAISGCRAPAIHWSRLDPLDPTMVGDSKVIWELNRHQWLVRLGQAYRFTRDERYANAFVRSVQEWIPANPVGIGINWTSSLEVALRLISWCWALILFQQSVQLSPSLFLAMLSQVWAHASHIMRYLSYYFSPNTHLTGEALGLFYAGILFPRFRAARRWRELGARILVEQSDRQVLADGVYFEQSTCYQRYTAEIYMHFLILATRNGLILPSVVGQRLASLLDFLLAVRHPDGSMPQIGDADGGWLLPLETRAADDLRGVFSTAAAIFDRSDYAWGAEGRAPETAWLLGVSGLALLDGIRPAPPARPPSVVFPDGGYAVMRSSWDVRAHQLILDGGPIGCSVTSGHGHADLLSVQCSAFGRAYVADSGTYGYAAAGEWRDYFRSSAAHSTVVVDGGGQSTPAGPFAWTSRPSARFRQWRSTEAYDFADAEHDAYRGLPDPVSHRRRVVFVKPRYWIIVDDLEGVAEHRVSLRFQFAPVEVTIDAELWARARAPEGHGLIIRPFAAVPLKAQVAEGDLHPIQGWISREYGQRTPAPSVSYEAVVRLPVRILTLLLPVENALAPIPHVSALDAGAGPVGLVFTDTSERLCLDEAGAVLIEGRASCAG